MTGRRRAKIFEVFYSGNDLLHSVKYTFFVASDFAHELRRATAASGQIVQVADPIIHLDCLGHI